MCFKKKIEKEINANFYEDRKNILLASQEMEIIKELDSDSKYEKEIEVIQDMLLYISPRSNKQVCQIDDKIRDKIGEIRLVLNNKKDPDEDVVKSMFKEIRILIKEREAKELK